MARINIREADPVRYAQIKIEQEEIRNSIQSKLTVTITCPYCSHVTGKIYRGTFSPFETKCDNCGEIIIYPPLSFSRTA